MGAQIAAHCANADVAVLLFDLPAKGGQAQRHRRQGAGRPQEARPRTAGTSRPGPVHRGRQLWLRSREAARLRSHHRGHRRENGVEARSLCQGRALHPRRRDLRLQHLRAVDQCLSEGMPAALRPRFCGIHFFNPPRYMALVELIRTATTDAAMLDELETWLTTRLGKASCAPRTPPTSSPTASACSRSSP